MGRIVQPTHQDAHKLGIPHTHHSLPFRLRHEYAKEGASYRRHYDRFNGAEITRRAFTKLAAAGLAGSVILTGTAAPVLADEPCFTLYIVPDPQFLSGDSNVVNGGCLMNGVLYNNLVNWGINNKNLVVDGDPLNALAFITVGDLSESTSTGTSDSNANTQRNVTVDAWQLAEDAGMGVLYNIGNHDYDLSTGPRNSDMRNAVSYSWREPTGEWSPTNLASIYGGPFDLGNGNYMAWGGHYNDPSFPVSSANHYMFIRAYSRKILIFSLEFWPRTSVMNWAKGIHDQNLDCEVYVVTHGYLTPVGNRFAFSEPNGNTNDPIKRFDENQGLANSAEQLWNGNGFVSFGGLKDWSNLRGVFCGHALNGYDVINNKWVWRQNTVVNNLGYDVQEIFVNCQEHDYPGGYATGAPGTGSAAPCFSQNPNNLDTSIEVAHLMMFRIYPTRCEGYLVSTHNGKWVGSKPANNAAYSGSISTSPIRLFNVPFTGIGRRGPRLTGSGNARGALIR